MAIKKGDKVKLDYEGKLDDGIVFDSSKHGDHSHPLEFEVGSGQVIKGFDEAIIGMEINEEKEFQIKPSEGYGEPNPTLIKEIPKSGAPNEEKLEKGMIISLVSPDGKQFPASIIEVTNKNIKIDLNHPLAGKNLNFKIKIIEIS